MQMMDQSVRYAGSQNAAILENMEKSGNLMQN